MWSIRAEVLHVVLVGPFTSCLKPYVEQNSVYFLMSDETSLQNCLNSFGLLKIYFPLKSSLILNLQERSVHHLYPVFQFNDLF